MKDGNGKDEGRVSNRSSNRPSMGPEWLETSQWEGEGKAATGPGGALPTGRDLFFFLRFGCCKDSKRIMRRSDNDIKERRCWQENKRKREKGARKRAARGE